jgi:hypothetical protein
MIFVTPLPNDCGGVIRGIVIDYDYLERISAILRGNRTEALLQVTNSIPRADNHAHFNRWIHDGALFSSIMKF